MTRASGTAPWLGFDSLSPPVRTPACRAMNCRCERRGITEFRGFISRIALSISRAFLGVRVQNPGRGSQTGVDGTSRSVGEFGAIFFSRRTGWQSSKSCEMFQFLRNLVKRVIRTSRARPCSQQRIRHTSPFPADARHDLTCLLYTSPSPRDATLSRMPSSA